LQEPLAPQRHLAAVQPDLGGDVLVLHAFGRQQHDARTLLKPHLDALALRQHPKLSLCLRIQLDRLGNPHRPPPGAVGVCRRL
jgi:hypothetical protein